MDFKAAIDEFKIKHLEGKSELGFSLLPLLMQELIKKGLNVSHASGKFYQDLASEFFEDQELQLYAIDALILLGQSIPLPKTAIVSEPIKEITKNKIEAVIENSIIKTDHLINNIPHEDEEGDPFFIPPEERIFLRPEDMAPMEYDEEFCKLIGVDTSKRQNR